MTLEQKAINRYRFRVAAFVYFAVMLVMAFILAALEKDLTGFGIVAGAVATPMTGLLVADYATSPREK